MQLKQIITVEPLVIAYMTVSAWREFVFQDHRSFFDYSNESSSFPWNSMNIIQISLSTVSLVFFGACSDKNCRRKLFFLLPILGEILAIEGYTLCAVFEGKCPHQLNFFFQIVPSCFGASHLVVVMALAYIADVSTSKSKIIRIGSVYVFEILSQLTLNVNVAQKGVRSDKERFWIWGITNRLLCIFMVLYVVFWLVEPRPPNILPGKSLFSDLFNFKHIKATFGVLSKKALGASRINFLVILWIISIHKAAFFGEYFPMTHKYDCYSYLMILIYILILAILPFLLTKIFHMDDSIVLIVGCVLKIVSSLVITILGIPKTLEFLKIGMYAAIPSKLIKIGATATATKMVTPKNFGKSLALVYIAKSMGLGVFYVLLYAFGTDGVNPRNLYIGPILYSISVGIVLGTYCRTKRVNDEVDRNANSSHEMDQA